MKLLIISLKVLWRWIVYSLVSILCLVIVLLYLRHVSLISFHYEFHHEDIYFLITAALLPFFRLFYNNWFISTNNTASYRKKALDTYHQEMARQQKNKKWSSNGTYVNPWEYTTPYTQDYDSSLNWVYDLAKSLFISLLFIGFAPIFFVLVIKRRWIKK